MSKAGGYMARDELSILEAARRSSAGETHEDHGWSTPRPIETAPKDARILAYFGPNRGGWYIAFWYKLPGKGWSPYWRPEGEVFGSRWARNNQPQCWLPLPPKVSMVWSFES